MSKCACENCEWTGDASDTLAVSDPMERLGPNPHVLLPVGDCPECGSMVYDPEDEREYEERAARLRAYDKLCDAAETALALAKAPNPPADLAERMKAILGPVLDTKKP